MTGAKIAPRLVFSPMGAGCLSTGDVQGCRRSSETTFQKIYMLREVYCLFFVYVRGLHNSRPRTLSTIRRSGRSFVSCRTVFPHKIN